MRQILQNKTTVRQILQFVQNSPFLWISWLTSSSQYYLYTIIDFLLRFLQLKSQHFIPNVDPLVHIIIALANLKYQDRPQSGFPQTFPLRHTCTNTHTHQNWCEHTHALNILYTYKQHTPTNTHTDMQATPTDTHAHKYWHTNMPKDISIVHIWSSSLFSSCSQLPTLFFTKNISIHMDWLCFHSKDHYHGQRHYFYKAKYILTYWQP